MAEAVGQTLTVELDETNKANGKHYADLVRLLQSVNSMGELAKLNETTISDNNGGRIEL